MPTAETAARPASVFWVGFCVGWLLYFGVSLSLAMLDSGSLGWSLSLAVANTLPPALTGSVVALNRRRLFRPEWRVRRTLAVHVGVGFLFAVSTALILLALMEVMDVELPELRGKALGVRIAMTSVGSGFLYTVFAGALMWSESVRRVHQSRRTAAREAVLRAEAEAKAVRAQFNPHFVFNTLHSLMLLVRADPAAAERAIEDVATLIRYASIVQRQDIDAVPLAKELEVARRYVALERLRLGERLDLAWNVAVDASALTVPAFALQTLVENAIKHGIEPTTEGGTVEVVAESASGALSLTVRDDGAGAEAGSVSAESGRGLGLLRRRLESRYDGRGTIEWSGAPGRGFEVRLSIPAERPVARPALDVIEERSPAGTEVGG